MEARPRLVWHYRLASLAPIPSQQDNSDMRRRYVLGLVSVNVSVALSACSPSASLPNARGTTSTSSPASVEETGIAYVIDNADGGIVIPINLQQGTTAEFISVGGRGASASDVPTGIVILPDEHTAYVPVMPNTTSSAVVPIDLARDRALTPIDLPGVAGATGIVASTVTGIAYLTQWHSPDLVPVDLASRSVKPPIVLPSGDEIWNVSLSPDGKTAYATVTTSTNSVVITINLVTKSAGSPIAMSGTLGSIAVAPDGTTAYVVVENDLVPIDLRTNTAEAPITLTAQPVAGGTVVVSPDGTTVYVMSQGADFAGCGLVPVDTKTKRAKAPIDVAGPNNYCYNLAITSDDRLAYVTGDVGPPISASAGRVFPVNLGSGTTRTPISVPAGAGALVIAS